MLSKSARFTQTSEIKCALAFASSEAVLHAIRIPASTGIGAANK